MRSIIAACLLTASITPVLADGFVMGSGRWTCGQAIQAWQGKPIDKGQVAGWILGFWSAATFTRETGFVDTVERAGGLKIIEATLAECSKTSPDTPLYRVAQGMIENTK